MIVPDVSIYMLVVFTSYQIIDFLFYFLGGDDGLGTLSLYIFYSSSDLGP
jgi:hypothetical protein